MRRAGRPTSWRASWAPRWAPSSGQAVVIDNKSGGSGNIAMEAAGQAAPDGYTLVMPTVAQAINMTLFRKPGYDLIGGFAPVALLSYYAFILVVNPDLPVKTFQELIALARQRPLNYASSGNGSVPHVGMSLLCNLTGVEMTHVPYRGSGPAIADLIAGSVQLTLDNPPSLLPQIRSAKLRAIAVTGLERTPELPDVPTIAESGVPGYEALGWNCLLAPVGTPAGRRGEAQRSDEQGARRSAGEGAHRAGRRAHATADAGTGSERS